MDWKPIKRELFVTIEGIQKEADMDECTDFLFKECKKFDVSECDDYWSACWEKFRVKVFNKIKYEGDRYHSAEYVYDISVMKHLLIIVGSLLSIIIILVLNL
jgi:hypothetical protein